MMARTQTVTARVDSSVKSEAEKVFLALGLTTPQAIKLFLTQVKLNRGIPFDLTVPNRTTLKAVRDADAKRNSKTFKTTKALFKDLGI
jgi:DNA-damage-inducible protein J